MNQNAQDALAHLSMVAADLASASDDAANALAAAGDAYAMTMPVVEDYQPIASSTVPVAPKPVYLSAHSTDRLMLAASTWFDFHGAIIGAAHSLEGWGFSRSEWPKWTQEYGDHDIIHRPNGLDITIFGFNALRGFPPPPKLVEGMPVIIRGYPGGSTVNGRYEIRVGKLLMDRPEDTRNGDAESWIIVLADGSQVVIGGMSGGSASIVTAPGFEWPIDKIPMNGGDLTRPSGITEAMVQRWLGGAKEEVSGVLVTQNGAFDHDMNPATAKRNSCDIVEGRDAYEAVMDNPESWTWAAQKNALQWTVT